MVFCFCFVYANGRKVVRYDMNKECRRLTLKHRGNPEKAPVVTAIFVYSQFGHQAKICPSKQSPSDQRSLK